MAILILIAIQIAHSLISHWKVIHPPVNKNVNRFSHIRHMVVTPIKDS